MQTVVRLGLCAGILASLFAAPPSTDARQLPPIAIAAAPAYPATLDDEAVIRQAIADGRLDAALANGGDALVLYDDGVVLNRAAQRRTLQGKPADDGAALIDKQADYRVLKASVVPAGAPILTEYPNFGVQHVLFSSVADLASVLRRSQVQRIAENGVAAGTLKESLPLIRQPRAAALGFVGEGVSVAVIDTGVDYLNAAFGCTAVATPASCKVVYAQDFATNDGQRDDDGHGTNVSATVLGVAPSAKVIGLDVFNGATASNATTLAALNWVVQNQATYNIRSVNMSLGSSQTYATSNCSSYATSAFANLRSAGILPVVSAGNDAFASGAFRSGLANPACAAGALSVGAVYDTDLGGTNFGDCSDSTTAADKVTCFSQSASILGVLAPGGRITAAGLSMFGTSQASPHVAGAAAVLAAANKGATAAQIEGAITGNGPEIVDPRNNVKKRRLDLLSAVCAIASCDGSSPSPTPAAPVRAVQVANLLINVAGLTPTPTPPAGGGTIAGRFTAIGAPAASMLVELRRCQSAICTSVMTTTTSSDGRYSFSAAAIEAGNSYQVRWRNSQNGSNSALLSRWESLAIANLASGQMVTVADADLKNIPLTFPANNASGAAPVTFSWTARGFAADSYRLVFFDVPTNGDVCSSNPLGTAATLAFNTNPACLEPDRFYGWYLTVTTTAGTGTSFFYRNVRFLSSGASVVASTPESALDPASR